MYDMIYEINGHNSDFTHFFGENPSLYFTEVLDERVCSKLINDFDNLSLMYGTNNYTCWSKLLDV